MLEKFNFKKSLELRYSDFDMMGHVNNAMYLTYFEYVRILYTTEICQWDIKETGLVVANATIDFRSSIVRSSNPIIHIRCNRLGNKSFGFEYIISEADNPEIIYATGFTTMVTLNVKTNETMRLPDIYREKIKNYDHV